MENLDHLQQLDTLNVSNNTIYKIENISKLYFCWVYVAKIQTGLSSSFYIIFLLKVESWVSPIVNWQNFKQRNLNNYYSHINQNQNFMFRVVLFYFITPMSSQFN